MKGKIPQTASKTHKNAVHRKHTQYVAQGGYDAGAVLDWLKKDDMACNTARWRWNDNDRQHQIDINEGVYHAITKPAKDIPNVTGFLQSIYRHERAHACHSYRNLDLLFRDAQSRGINLQLLNLIEDNRVEHLTRVEEGNKFRWENWREYPANYETDPVMALFAITISENSRSLRKHIYRCGYYSPKNGSELGGKTIYNLLARVHKGDGYKDLLRYTKWFQDLFGLKDKQDIPQLNGSTGDDGDMTQAKRTSRVYDPTAQQAGDGTQQGNNDSDTFGGGYSAGAHPGTFDTVNGRVIAHGHIDHAKSPISLTRLTKKWNLTPSQIPIMRERFAHDPDTYRQARRYFVGLTAKGRGKASSDHGKRINVGKLATMQVRRMFEGKDDSDKARPNLCVMIDSSASMEGSPHRNAKAIARAIRDCPDIEATFIFTYGDGAWVLSQHQLDDNTLSQLIPMAQGEGIASTLQDIPREIANHDTCIVLTDAEILEAAPDWTSVQRHGLTNVIGVYAGGASDRHRLDKIRRDMAEHFPRFVVGDDIDDVLGRLRQLIRR